MARRGFMYSVFAIFMIGIFLLVITNPIVTDSLTSRSEIARLDETFYFYTSVENDLTRVSRISSTRAFSSAINFVILGNPMNSSEREVISAFRNGTINGSEQPLMEGSSVDDWKEKMEDQASRGSWDLKIEIIDSSTYPSAPARATIESTFDINLRDGTSDSSIHREVNSTADVSLGNMTDPLVSLETDGLYSKGFVECGYDNHAILSSTGSEKHYDSAPNWTSGEAVVRPSNGDVSSVSDRDEKVLLVSDICAYSDSEISGDVSAFKGIVSEQSGGISSDGNTICTDADSSAFSSYVGGASGATSDVEDGSTAVLNDMEVWQNNMKEELERGCYFSDSTGPTIFGRLEGNLTKDAKYADGWGSFLFLPDLPSSFQDSSRSSLAHVYFNDSFYGQNHKIKGVTDHHSWFKLDQEHIDSWGINSLSYD